MSESGQINWNSCSADQRKKYIKHHEPDCSFSVSSNLVHAKIVLCHKAILSSVSPEFKRMFDGDFKEASTCHKIEITDIEEPQDFQKFCDYLYCKDNYVFRYYSTQTLIQLANLGDKYQIDTLTKLCKEKIDEKKCRPQLPMTDILSLFSYDYVKEINHSSSPDVVSSTKFVKQLKNRAAEIKDVHRIYSYETSLFSKLLDFVKDNSTTISLFHMIERYALQNGLDMNSSRDILEPWIAYVDFFKMSLAEFGNGPMCSKVLNLSLEEKHNILVELCEIHGCFAPK